MGKSITIYGSHTCEDTALVRDRLLTFKIPFTEHDKEDSPRVRELLDRYGRGSPRTPTIVIGDNDEVLIEPSLPQLEDALVAAGYSISLPNVIQFGKNLSDRPAPDFVLPSTKGERFELARLRGWRRAVLFFAHDHTCRVCQGYGRQLVRFQSQWSEMETRTLIVLQDDVAHTRRWAQEFVGDSEVLADADGSVKRALAGHFANALNSRHEGTIALVLDRYTAPRVGSYAPDAGGLIAPHEIDSWLHLLDYECDE